MRCTRIAWTGVTWNPWTGCTKVSPGCAKCYMFRGKRRFGQDPALITRSSAATFAAPLRLTAPERIFTCSWSDFFHEAADPWRAEAWDIIRRTPQHTYQVLTKRPERIGDHLPADWGEGYPNVWLGVSIENQRWMTRLEELIAIPARTRFISAEPLLGAVAFDEVLTTSQLREAVHWVIVGGESGPDAQRREMDLAWMSSVVAQCDEAGIPVFVKQDSARVDSQQGRIPDDLWARKEFPPDAGDTSTSSG